MRGGKIFSVLLFTVELNSVAAGVFNIFMPLNRNSPRRAPHRKGNVIVTSTNRSSAALFYLQRQISFFPTCRTL
jgi:hypothetical protein